MPLPISISKVYMHENAICLYTTINTSKALLMCVCVYVLVCLKEREKVESKREGSHSSRGNC